MSNPILKHFEYKRLPIELQKVGKTFSDIAVLMDEKLPDDQEKDMGLRKLLEAKDCFVRAVS